ncbi:MAG: hypothetical protein K5639_02235 [Eubacterium sp.]|nr:hypothetical protein [Eubacterium sp.]
MKSKTSFFNKTLFLEDMRRQIATIVWTVLIFGVFVFIPSLVRHGGSLTRDTLYLLTFPYMIAAVCLVMTLTVFAYLFKKKNSYMLHSFAPKRIAHFISHGLAGLCTLFIMTLLVYVMVFIMNNNNYNLIVIIRCLINTLIQILFFYSLALVIVLVCGNMVIGAITFAVVNFFWYFINIFAAVMHNAVKFCFLEPYRNYSSFGWNMFEDLDMLFPMYFFAKRQPASVEGYVQHIVDGDFGGITSFSCLWMLIPTVLLFVAAAFLYKYRKLENTGDIVIFGWSKVVCRVMFTIGGAGIVAGGIAAPVASEPIESILEYLGTGGIALLILPIIIGGFIGFIVSEMLLQKTVHIFKGKKIPPFIQGAIPVALMSAYVVIEAVKNT